jgi:DNA-binding response OmpR family regulator
MRVLLVEDHNPPRPDLRQGLEEVNFIVDTVGVVEADAQARGSAYDVILLDMTLSDGDGLDLLRGWRRDGLHTHVLALTPVCSPQERARSLDAGADDCLSGPFEREELVARLRALIRRQYQIKDPVIRVHDLEIDTPSRTVKRAQRIITLTPREYALLEFLAFRRGKVASRGVIWEHLSGYRDRSNSNVVDVHISYLRNKIDKGFNPPLILTRWGEGYLLRGD